MKKQALGKGLGALLGSTETLGGERVTHVDVELIRPNQYQPRRSFNKEKIAELAESIKSGGIIQPLVVRRAGTSFELISGERRLQAARLAGLKVVPVILRELDERQVLVMALVENLQRVDLNPVDEANALERLIDEFGLSHQEVGRAIGKSRTHISNMLRIRRLPPLILEFLSNGDVSFGHAKVLAGIKDGQLAVALARKVVNAGLSVRQLEQMAADRKPGKIKVPRGTSRTKLPPKLQQAEKNLSTILGTQVRILKGKRKGKIEIVFSTADELDLILSRMLS